MDQVRFAIIGTGGISKPHARAIKANPRAELVGLCDIIPERMEEYKKLFDVPDAITSEDFNELCQNPNIDAVFVGTPNQVHVPAALAAVTNGKHVLSTKPLSSSEEAARKLVEALDEADVVNMMSLTMRFSNQVQYLRKLIEAGEFGDFYYARARSVRRSGIPDWNLGFIEAGGGAFRDMGVHVLDSSWWLLGMPEPLSASGVGGAKFGPHGEGYWKFKRPSEDYWRRYDSDDYAGGIIRFKDGTGLQVESFWASHQPEEVQIELFGTEAGARLQPLTLYRTVNEAPQDLTINLPEEGNSFENIINHFVDCIIDDVECAAPIRHGYIVQTMMEAMLRSAELGQEVSWDK